ncbi:MAG: hypothetical protein R3E99_13720 [Burkholderiaceae bacterium]
MSMSFKPFPWLFLMLALTGCSPTFNWRELRDDAVELQAVMPCKPEQAERQVPMAGQMLALHMHSCEAGGLNFAIAWMRLPDTASAQAVLDPWRMATLATLQVDRASAADPALSWSVQVHGDDLARGLQAQGVAPTGQAIQVRAAYFTKGAHAYQAAVYGPQIDHEVAASFFEPLRLP